MKTLTPTFSYTQAAPAPRDQFRSIGATVTGWRVRRGIYVHAHAMHATNALRQAPVLDAPANDFVLHATANAKYSTAVDRAIASSVSDNYTPESIVQVLNRSGREATAYRISELIRICKEDEEENYRMDSLVAIATFFVGSVPKDKSIDDISLSPDGTFVAEWVGPDGKILVALEFLGAGDKVLLIRTIDGRARASQVDPLEAQRYLP